MKIQSINSFTMFKGKPSNYGVIDKYISRSAQPASEDLEWLKEQGVTDIINFRTLYVPGIDFEEEKAVEKLGMKYHNIPSITKSPTEKNVNQFLNLINDISNKNGKAHIHCMAGADRTGMYAFIYKTLKGIGTVLENEKEWIQFGHNIEKYPDLRQWTKDFIKTFKNKKICNKI